MIGKKFQYWKTMVEILPKLRQKSLFFFRKCRFPIMVFQLFERTLANAKLTTRQLFNHLWLPNSVKLLLFEN